MGMGGGSRGGVNSDINVTPLVDVVLVLLIIFMVVTPISLKQLDVNVPRKLADVEVEPSTDAQIILKLTVDGKVSINDEGIAVETVAAKISEALRGSRGKVVFFNIEDDANYGEAVHLMDVCRGAGAKTLGIMTAPSPAEGATPPAAPPPAAP